MPRRPRILASPAFSWVRLIRDLRVVGSAATVLLAPVVSAAEPGLETFHREIQPILKQYCFECHGDGVAKGGVTLDEFKDAAGLHDPKLWSRALKNVRTGIMPPVEGDPLPTPEAEKIMQWIKHDAMGLDPARPDPGRVTVRRLNRVEYRNTIRELTGVDYDTQKEFPADDTGHGFDNIADVLTVSPMLLEKYLDTAQAIVTKAVPMVSRTVAETPVWGRQFATIKVDTTIPEQPKPAMPEPATTEVASSASPATPPTGTPPPVFVANAAPTTANGSIPNAPAPTADPSALLAVDGTASGATPATPGFPGRGRNGRGGRGPAGPAPVLRPVPTVEGNSIDLSYYTPSVVATTYHVDRAGKYQLVLDLSAVERYVDNQFDLNRCRLIIRSDGETLLDREFLRESGKKFDFGYDRDWATGDHEISFEIIPAAPEQPQIRSLKFRLNAVTVRGPLEEKYWVKPKGYEKFFPREVPVDQTARRAYVRELLEKFAMRAFRRPVDAVTLDRLVEVAENVFSQSKNTFEAGVAQAMVAVLASPRFIFREEETEPLRDGQAYPFVDEYALASRLSYFFWSSMPDEELFHLAREGRLRANLSAQMARMLADPRSGELVRNFTGQWLQARDITTVPITALDVYLRDNPNPAYDEARATLDRLQAKPQSERTPEEVTTIGQVRRIVFGVNRSPKPQLTDPLRRAMQQETEMVFAYILKEDRSLLELIESDYTFVNDILAQHYALEGVTGSAMRKITLPPDSPRGGVLTQGTVLAVTSNPTRTSPVKRGVFVLDAILGAPPAPPPPNIPALEDAAPAAELRTMTLRDTLALHAKKKSCAACHSRMDPLGLALENFNALGVWRTSEFNRPVLPAGRLITGESFTDIRALKHLLATAHRRDFYYCISEKLLTYALGRGLEYYDTLTLDQLVAGLEASHGQPSTLLQGIVNSAAFQQRRQQNPSATTDVLPESTPTSAPLAQAGH